MENIPLELLFAGTAIFIIIAISLGYSIGNRYSDEKKKQIEKFTSASATTILSLLSFILVFAFGLVYSRYDDKKTHVREEAEIIESIFLRTDFLSQDDRVKSQWLLKEYVDLRVTYVQLGDKDSIKSNTKKAKNIQTQLWQIAVSNAKLDMNSDVGALYVESLNQLISMHLTRYVLAIISRLPVFIWIVLYLLIFLGMFSFGYQNAIDNSRMSSWLTPIMALTFSLMVILIAALDTHSSYIKISQQPIIEVQQLINERITQPK